MKSDGFLMAYGEYGAVTTDPFVCWWTKLIMHRLCCVWRMCVVVCRRAYSRNMYAARPLGAYCQRKMGALTMQRRMFLMNTFTKFEYNMICMFLTRFQNWTSHASVIYGARFVWESCRVCARCMRALGAPKMFVWCTQHVHVHSDIEYVTIYLVYNTMLFHMLLLLLLLFIGPNGGTQR